MTGPPKTLGVGVIGLGWMGEVHARSYLRAPRHFPDDNTAVDLVVCADNVAHRAEQTARRFGFKQHTTDWRAAATHPQVDLLSVTAPNRLHLEIIESAAAAGKHIFCEKPVGRCLDETARAEAAARAAGVVTGVGYNYRWAPMVQHCAQLIADGALGGIRHFHGRFFTMYGSHPLSRLTWRFDREVSGHGAAGDILAHVIDTALFLAGPVKRVVARKQTDITERPLPAPGGTHFSLGKDSDRKGAVTNEDYAGALLEFTGGAGGTVEASRTVLGPKCEMAFEIYGDKGALRWDFERMNEAQLYLRDSNTDGFTRIIAGEQHPAHGRFNPGEAVGIGYEDLKVIELRDFLRRAARNDTADPGFTRALAAAQVVDAVLRSCDSGGWEEV